MLRKTMIAAAVVALAVCAGCQTHAENKKLAEQRWRKASANIKLTLARQQYDNGKYEQAAKTIQECISVDPDSTLAHLLYGKLLLAQGHLYRARQELGLAVEQNSRIDEGWYWLGVVAEQQRNYPRAYQYYRTAMLLEPANVDYILAVVDAQVALGRCEEVQKLLAEKMTMMPGEVSLKVASADLMLRNGEPEKGARLYEQAMLLSSEDDDIAESLGYCYILGERWADAARIFEELTTSGQRRKDKDEAKRQTWLQLLCMCNMNARQYGRAVSSYRKLGVLERENADFWLQMGQAALGAGSAKRAFVCSQRALSVRPGWADAMALRGCAQYMAKDYAAAVKSFETVAGDEKNAQLCWLMRGRCYEHLGEKNKADWAYKKALEMKPEGELAKLLAKGTQAKTYHPRLEF